VKETSVSISSIDLALHRALGNRQRRCIQGRSRPPSRGSNLSIRRTRDSGGDRPTNAHSSSSRSLFSPYLCSFHLSSARFSLLPLSLSCARAPTFSFSWRSKPNANVLDGRCNDGAMHVVALVSTSTLLVSPSVRLALAVGAHRASNSPLHQRGSQLPLWLLLRHRHLHSAR